MNPGPLTRLPAETIMVPKRFQLTMPTTLTLKNIPDALYERLKKSAETHRRSLNFEAIVCLEEVLLPTRVTPAERLERARSIAASLRPGPFDPEDIDDFKRAGRK